MAIYNEILAPRFARAIQKIFSMKGLSAMRQVSGECMPVLNFFRGAEDRFHEAWARFGEATSLAASAGNTSGVRFRNPAGSNYAITIESLVISETVTDTPSIVFGTIGTDLTTIISTVGNRLDARQGLGASQGIFSSQNNTPVIAGFGFPLYLPSMLANTPFSPITDENQELTLLPGDGIQVITGAVNISLRVGLITRERLLEESERQ